MQKIMMAFILVIGFGLKSFAASGAKEELTCGLVVDVKKIDQLVVLKPLNKAGVLENTQVTRMVLPDSVTLAQTVKGNPRMKYCIQMPIAQGGRYKTWASVMKKGLASNSQRLGSIE
ncbi:MAG: hypothetical protein ACAH59_13150 [Pseudobdellovibrionaceae bacterium]